MTDYERYVAMLAAKYAVDPIAMQYDGDCVVYEAADDDERWRMACLWERFHVHDGDER